MMRSRKYQNESVEVVAADEPVEGEDEHVEGQDGAVPDCDEKVIRINFLSGGSVESFCFQI